MWIIISIILAINSMWLLKLNKDLIERNEYLIRKVEANRHNSGMIVEPMSDEELDALKKAWQDKANKDTDNKED